MLFISILIPTLSALLTFCTANVARVNSLIILLNVKRSFTNKQQYLQLVMIYAGINNNYSNQLTVSYSRSLEFYQFVLNMQNQMNEQFQARAQPVGKNFFHHKKNVKQPLKKQKKNLQHSGIAEISSRHFQNNSRNALVTIAQFGISRHTR